MVINFEFCAALYSGLVHNLHIKNHGQKLLLWPLPERLSVCAHGPHNSLGPKQLQDKGRMFFVLEAENSSEIFNK